jgi:hypothetical protein
MCVSLESNPRDFESFGLTISEYIHPYIQANPECSSCKKVLLKLAIKQRGLKGGKGFSLEQTSPYINTSSL